MFKDLPKNCVVIGGFSESPAVLEGLANALTHPNTGLFVDAGVQTAAEHHKNPEKYAMNEVSAIGHSYGEAVVKSAFQMIALNGAEPTPLSRQAIRATKIAFEKVEPEEGLRADMASFKHPVKELIRHGFTPWIPLDVRKHSASQRLAFAHDVFPGGRMLIEANDDSFGFTRDEALVFASLNGVITARVPGKHNTALYRPNEYVNHIRKILNFINC